ncbi:MAG: hypothetical protein RI964_3081 [Pseudomonadota bacterium]|jgi:ABC transporter substrate binding protein (PQQ-dependent alcohol dehydrogenase system)
MRHWLYPVLCCWALSYPAWAEDPSRVAAPSDTPATPAAAEPAAANASPDAAKPQKTLTFGYLEQTDDPRYDEKHLRAEFLGEPLGRPYAGAEVALKEIKYHGQAAGVQFALEKAEAATAADLIKQVETLQGKGVRFILADLPATTLTAVTSAFKGKDVVFLNVSAQDDSLRQEQCQANTFHTIPNYAMQADGLVQYLVAHKWKEVLVLQGPSETDKLLTAAFARAAKRYGVKITETRDFVLGSDPREREKNNIALLTGDADYDTVYIADSDGEFARNAAYQTLEPRPVIGSAGLNALAWTWAWDRDGASQVQKRFEKQANRHMADVDWAAWMAVKIVGRAVQQTNTDDFAKLRDFLGTPDNALDGTKGSASDFRPWDHQLRQPLLLSTQNWVAEVAPVQGFLHQKNNLDTLGFDERDSTCKF